MSHTGRLLLVHAHPDDETLCTGGTIAKYLAEGAEVSVLTCTLGEEGEVIGPRWAGLVAAEGDQLGGYRIGELTAALAALGSSKGPRFLGGAGYWRDSGMVGAASNSHPRAFIGANRDEASGLLVEVIRSLRPHVVITYDPSGTYGHPDHLLAHELLTDAVEEAANPDSYRWAGPVWDVEKFYWTVTEVSALRAGLDAVGEIPDGWRLPYAGELPSLPAAAIHTQIDCSAVAHRVIAAMRAHATQISVAPGERSFALSNNIVQPILTSEHFVLARGNTGKLGPEGREADLFSGTTADPASARHP